MRVMGLDFGSKTCGVAVTDALGLTAQGLCVIWRKEENKLRKTLARIEELCKEYEVSLIVLGFPKNMDGSFSERCQLSMEFSEKLKRRTGLSVVLHDERLTTEEANEIMALAGIKSKDRKKSIDRLAAVLILEDYLSRSENRREDG